MNLKLSKFAFFAAILFFCSFNANAQTFAIGEDESLGMETPQEVLKLLRNDEGVKFCLKENPDVKFDASWFQSDGVNLNNDDYGDLVVMPKQECLTNPYRQDFWVFKRTGESYELVLKTTAYALEIINTETLNHRNIKVTYFGGADENPEKVTFAFNGKSYAKKAAPAAKRRSAKRTK